MALQPPGKKTTAGIIATIVVPSVLWTTLMFFCDSATGTVFNFKASNDTTHVIAFQDIPEEERDKVGAVVALKCSVWAQLITIFLLFACIIYTSYMTTLKTALKQPEAETPKSPTAINKTAGSKLVDLW